MLRMKNTLMHSATGFASFLRVLGCSMFFLLCVLECIVCFTSFIFKENLSRLLTNKTGFGFAISTRFIGGRPSPALYIFTLCVFTFLSLPEF